MNYKKNKYENISKNIDKQFNFSSFHPIHQKWEATINEILEKYTNSEHVVEVFLTFINFYNEKLVR